MENKKEKECNGLEPIEDIIIDDDIVDDSMEDFDVDDPDILDDMLITMYGPDIIEDVMYGPNPDDILPDMYGPDPNDIDNWHEYTPQDLDFEDIDAILLDDGESKKKNQDGKPNDSTGIC